MKLRSIIAIVALLFLPLFTSATQLYGPTFCYPLGEWDTAANLASDRAAASYPCAQASTVDDGPMWNNGTSWVTFASLVPAQTPTAIGSPTARTLSLSTAYQATTTANAAIVTVNLSSAASLSLTTGTTNTASIVIGSTSAVASGTGTTVGTYSNSLTGTLVVGLGITQTSQATVTFALPAGWYFAVLTSSGTVTISSAFDQKLS